MLSSQSWHENPCPPLTKSGLKSRLRSAELVGLSLNQEPKLGHGLALSIFQSVNESELWVSDK